MLIPAAPALLADPVPVATVKAAFLYNLTKFTQWPSDTLAPGQGISLCVAGDPAVAEALGRIVAGHAVDGHELTAQVVAPDGPIRACHLLYVSGLDAKRSAQLLDALKGAPVFTVSDLDDFAESGGVAQLILENERMRFVVNAMSATRARLRVSSKLLSFARLVKDERHVQR